MEVAGSNIIVAVRQDNHCQCQHRWEPQQSARARVCIFFFCSASGQPLQCQHRCDPQQSARARVRSFFFVHPQQSARARAWRARFSFLVNPQQSVCAHACVCEVCFDILVHTYVLLVHAYASAHMCNIIIHTCGRCL